MLAVLDAAFVSRRDRVFAYNRAMDAHRRPFTTARVSQHFCGGLICLGLGIVNAGRTVRRVQFVDPLSVVATVYASIIWICHIGLSCGFGFQCLRWKSRFAPHCGLAILRRINTAAETMDNQVTAASACNFASLSNRRCLGWQHDGIALVTFTENCPPARPLNNMLVNLHFWSNDT